jgi:hypothetical protein
MTFVKEFLARYKLELNMPKTEVISSNPLISHITIVGAEENIIIPCNKVIR